MTDGDNVAGVASGAIAALKASPALLTLVLLNVVGLAAAIYFLHDLANDVGERNRMILERCLPQGNLRPESHQ